MATIHLPAQRLILAGAFTAALIIAPVVAVFAEPAAQPLPRIVAQTECADG